MFFFLKENELVIVDIDKNQIIIPNTIKLVEFPSEYVESLKYKLLGIDLHLIQTKKLTRLIKMSSYTLLFKLYNTFSNDFKSLKNGLEEYRK